MLLIFISALLLSSVQGYADYDDITDGDAYQDYGDYSDGNETSTTFSYEDSTINRVRRDDLKSSPRTLSPDDVREVRGALKELLSGIAVENPFTPFMMTYTPIQSSIMTSTALTKSAMFTSTSTYDTPTKSSIITSPSTYDSLTKSSIFSSTSTYDTLKSSISTYYTPTKSSIMTSTSTYDIPTKSSIITSTSTYDTPTKSSIITSTSTYDTPTKSSIITLTSTYDTPTKSSMITSTSTYDTPTTTSTYSTIATYITNLLTEIIQYTNSEPTRSKHLKHKSMELDTYLQRQGFSKMDESFFKKNNTNTTLPTSKRPDLDIPRLLAIISQLANEFETNLTRKLNETIISMTLPTCTTPTPEPPITSEYDANFTGSVVAKCFVCGLARPRIPRHAHCADAFAGDFLPLVPVDPTAKGRISTFRKYCKYSNVPGYSFNRSEPRTIMGRWTGGCSVRWIDLSGIYTQRSCRNRIQPTMGRHFASKRMAKLERTLWNVENGCITSPMATLVPLSRGISLYARFHACVCTGSWCNHTSTTAPWISFITILFLLCANIKL